ncbi:MAG: acyl-CoA dehydrogenase family protein [Ardenticatenaceae bacterium]|nr:acyl-CoA dehydrogenase family protein [Anaerolineales bacterium]MCB8921749.1 acyl-CoA dehydrogenase family protein [Ardenticatenaceae bacterium]
MIDFEIPDFIKNQQQLIKMVAEQAMRPFSRQLDEHEHERPQAFVNMTWPFTQQMMQRSLKPLMHNGNGNGHAPKKERTGPDYSALALIFMIEQLSWGDAGQYLCLPHPMLGGAAVQSAGTPEQQVRFLKRFTEGTPKWGAMAITEADAGSDNSSMRTTAVLDPDTHEWILNGEKIFITSGKLALEESDGICVVWATVDPKAGRAGIKSFVVEGHTPGVSIAKQEHKLGIRASDTVALHFDNVRVPYENLLGSAEVAQKKSSKGFQGAMKTFDSSRPAVAASAMGIARAALEFVIARLKEEGIEVDYTKPKHQLTAVERDIMEMEARYKAGWLLTLRATAQMAHGESNRLEASMCKYRAGEAVTWITQKAVELLGPLGYSRELLAEKWMRDAKINDIYEGTKQINQLIVARSILGYSRRELK